MLSVKKTIGSSCWAFVVVEMESRSRAVMSAVTVLMKRDVDFFILSIIFFYLFVNIP